jgi:protein-S-isoprenylcysteine O-methyltransferase Ste14
MPIPKVGISALSRSQKMKNLNPPSFMLLCLLSVILLHSYLPLWLISNWVLLILGIGLIVFGIVLGIAAEGQFRRSSTTVDPFGMPTKLVTDGWFKHSRNPMYLSFALMLMGAWLALGSASPLLVVIVYLYFTQRSYILPEEERLAQRFGQQYESYRMRSRRWL